MAHRAARYRLINLGFCHTDLAYQKLLAFLSGSLLIETSFSLDGLGRLGFEAAGARDYPVIFGTLFAFGLVGLLVNILSDLMYVFVDPRIDFEKREA